MTLVAITGVGMASSLGCDHEAIVRRLRAGERRFAPVTLFDASGFRVNLAAEVAELDIEARLGRGARRHHSRCDLLAMWAGRDALEQARLPKSRHAHAAVYVGASSGGFLAMEEARAKGQAPNFDAYWSYPVWATALAMANGLGLGGPRATFMTACSSAAHALGLAMRRLRAGELDVAVAGGVESLCRLTLAGFGSLGVLDPEGTRPFDAARKGITLGEGAAFFVLERLADAERRGAEVLGILAGYGAAADAHHMVHPKEDGAGALRAMRAALEDARIHPDDIDYINAHGTGTVQNDRMEAAAIRACFGDRASARVSSCKSVVGHTLGAGAAIELGLSLLAMRHGFVPPNAGCGTPTPELGALQLVRDAAAPAPRRMVSSSFAFGGNNAALLMTAPDALPAPPALSRRSVVITGGAVLTPVGTASDPNTLDALGFKSVGEARDAVDVDAAALLGAGVARRMDRLSQLVSAACKLAQISAAYAGPLAISSGTAFGALDASVAFIERLFTKGPTLVNPLEFPNLVHNASAGYASIALGAEGPCVTACQEEMAGDEAVRVALEQLASGDACAVIAVGGDLCSPHLDRGYAAVDRIFGTASHHATVVGAVTLEEEERCHARGAQPWARVLGSAASGPTRGPAEAVVRALTAAQPDVIDLWYCGATERAGRRAEDVIAEGVSALSGTQRIEVRTALGDAPGEGPAVLAMGAAAIAIGRARTVLVTSVTRQGCTHAVLLGRASGV